MIPNTWTKLSARLEKAGWTRQRRDDARTGYEIGYRAALRQLGDTSTPDSMVAAWHEYYNAAGVDAKNAVKRIEAEAEGGGA